MKNTRYSISFIYEDLKDNFISNLERLIRNELQNFAKEEIIAYFKKSIDILHNTINNTIEGPKIVVFFGSISSKNSNNCLNLINEALSLGIFIIPVIESPDVFRKSIPDVLSNINAFYWEGKVSPEKDLVHIIFENLGIDERHRKLFISYRRIDGLGMADQLFDALSRQRFNVFLDKYDIEVGYIVQQEIYESIDDKAFLLVLESPDAYNSKWMSKEIHYGLRNKMPILIISWCSDENRIEDTFGLPRIVLKNNEIINNGKYDLIGNEKLEEVIDQIESWHSYGLYKRRVNLIRSIEMEYKKEYGEVIYLENWVLYLKKSNKGNPNKVITITPRIPQSHDLFNLDFSIRCIKEPDLTIEKVLFHIAENIPSNQEEILKWILENKKNISVSRFI